jgi:osmoprotectant transport system substrate-binding protein
MRRAVLAALAALALAGCSSDEGYDAPTTDGPVAEQPIEEGAGSGDVALKIGSKNFTEQKVLGEIYAQGLRHAGFSVSTDLNLGDERTALEALEGGQISAYPEYTGTALLSFLDVKADQLPQDAGKAYDEVKSGLSSQGLDALPPTPYTSSNEVAVTRETAREYDLKTISDLSRVAGELTLYGSPECRQRLDCLLGLERVYGLEFKEFTPVDISQRHEVLTDGRADVSIVFTTDPQIRREGEVLLEDDKHMFPPYNSTLLLTKETAERAGPGLADTIERINQPLTDEAMRELNARVDLDKKEPGEVATEFLRETHLIG